MGGGRPHRPLKPLKQVSPGPQSNLTAGTVALAPAGASQGGLWYRGHPRGRPSREQGAAPAAQPCGDGERG